METIICILDIGTSKITAIIGKILDNQKIELCGLGENISHGIRKGVVVDVKKVREDIGMAITQAEKMANVRISSVVVVISTVNLTCHESNGYTLISGKVTDEQIQKATQNAKQFTLPSGYKIFHSITKYYSIDDSIVENPIDLYGNSLQVHMLTITGSEMIEENIKSCLTDVYIGNNPDGEYRQLKLQEIIVQPLASAMAVLSKDEKELGDVCSIDIGAGTSDVCVYIGKSIHYMSISPFAGDNITKDICRGLTTPLANAERLKKEVGSAQIKENENQPIETAGIGGDQFKIRTDKNTLNTVISSRIAEILEMIQRDLIIADLYDKINQIVITGGTALLTNIDECAREIFNDKTVRLGWPQSEHFLTLPNCYNEPKYSASLGALIFQREFGDYSHNSNTKKESKWSFFKKYSKLVN